MWYFLPAFASPELPPLRDEADVRYLLRTKRPAAALAWLRERMAAEPDEGKWVLAYLNGLALEPSLRHAALPAAAEAWGASNPEWAGVVQATAVAAAAMDPAVKAHGVFSSAGDWCEPALAALAQLPSTPSARNHTLLARLDAGRTCGIDVAADQALYKEEGRAGLLGPYLAAVHGLDDGIDPADLAAAKEALAAEPFRLGDLQRYAAPDATGPAAAEARAWMLDQSRSAMEADRPASLLLAAKVFSRAGLPEEESAARERLFALDPDNEDNLRTLAIAETGPANFEPLTILDPAERQAALLEEGRAEPDWHGSILWLSGVMDASEELGDADTFLWAATRAERLDERFVLQLGAASVAADRRLGRAERKLDLRIANLSDPPDRIAGFDGESVRAAAARQWATALDARAAVRVARGDVAGAIEDLEQAVVVGGFTADRRLSLAELYPPSFPLRAQALAVAAAYAPNDPRTEGVETTLAEVLKQTQLWLPPNAVSAYVAAVPRTADAPVRRLDGSMFDTLEVTIDGKVTRLLDLPGPLVVDLWATWCAPCIMSMPHLADLQRQWEGKVTVVAVSVDRDPAEAAAFLAARGEPGFVVAYSGEAGLKLAENGIPATFVFDADHELVGRTSGWGPGNEQLDQEVADMMR